MIQIFYIYVCVCVCIYCPMSIARKQNGSFYRFLPHKFRTSCIIFSRPVILIYKFDSETSFLNCSILAVYRKIGKINLKTNLAMPGVKKLSTNFYKKFITLRKIAICLRKIFTGIFYIIVEGWK